ncbi:hypothetical protein CEXT_499171 [Caerostris extrusa]|uniref:Uncharacterized protein n=1 Tax=Caerostris extrusa TaxID=172846 RepID=A0AAV4V5X2_CAEEX|nr:hypothetical protein CEXT_499171 [Caerostris extrusa]
MASSLGQRCGPIIPSCSRGHFLTQKCLQIRGKPSSTAKRDPFSKAKTCASNERLTKTGASNERKINASALSNSMGSRRKAKTSAPDEQKAKTLLMKDRQRLSVANHKRQKMQWTKGND